MMQHLSGGGAISGGALAGYYDPAAITAAVTKDAFVMSLQDEKEITPMERLIHFNERYNANNNNNSQNNNNAVDSTGISGVNSAMRAAVTSIMSARGGCSYGFHNTNVENSHIEQQRHNEPQQDQPQQLALPINDFAFDGGYISGAFSSGDASAAAAAAAARLFDPTAAPLIFPYSTDTAAKLAAVNALTRPPPTLADNNGGGLDLVSPQQQQSHTQSRNNNDSGVTATPFAPPSPSVAAATAAAATAGGIASAWSWYPNVSSTPTNCAAAALLSGYGNALAPPAAFAAAAAAAAVASSASDSARIPSTASANDDDNISSNGLYVNAAGLNPYFSTSSLPFGGFLPGSSLPFTPASVQMPSFTPAAAISIVDGNNNANNSAIAANGTSVTSIADGSTMPGNLGLGLSSTFSQGNFSCFSLSSPTSMSYLGSAHHEQPLAQQQTSGIDLLRSQQQQNSVRTSNGASSAFTRQLSTKLRNSKTVKAFNGRRTTLDGPFILSPTRDAGSEIIKSADDAIPTSTNAGTHSPSAATAPSTAEQGGLVFRTDCECRNCQELRIKGLPLDKKTERHGCHIPGCGKVYKKSSHLKAHMRWHCPDRQTTAVKRNSGSSNSGSNSKRRDNATTAPSAITNPSDGAQQLHTAAVVSSF